MPRSLSAALALILMLSTGAAATDLSDSSPQVVEPAAAGTTGESSTLPRLVIIIDDIGNHLEQGRAIVDLPGKLSIAVLPHTPHGAALAERAHRQGKEVLLHAPMSSRNGASPGPGALTPKMSEAQLREALANALGTVPHIRGVNNHMGSEMTASPEPMRWLMGALKEQGLYFVDSRTHKSTVAAQMAAEAGLPHLSRQVFLDNQRDKAFIEERLDAAIARAREEGTGVAIGHPYPETAEVLREQLPAMAARGVELALVSEALTPTGNRRAGTRFEGNAPLSGASRQDNCRNTEQHGVQPQQQGIQQQTGEQTQPGKLYPPRLPVAPQQGSQWHIGGGRCQGLPALEPPCLLTPPIQHPHAAQGEDAQGAKQQYRGQLPVRHQVCESPDCQCQQQRVPADARDAG